jgi:CRISPR/Cas system-associated protein Csm6
MDDEDLFRGANSDLDELVEAIYCYTSTAQSRMMSEIITGCLYRRDNLIVRHLVVVA